MKNNKSSKSTKQVNTYSKISKGVYMINGKYRVSKTTNGRTITSWFTSVNKAKTYYKSLIK